MKRINISVAINLTLSFLLFSFMDWTIGADPFNVRYFVINVILAAAVAYLFFILEPLINRNP